MPGVASGSVMRRKAVHGRAPKTRPTSVRRRPAASTARVVAKYATGSACSAMTKTTPANENRNGPALNPASWSM